MLHTKDYFMGRDVAYPDALTPEIAAHAEETTRRINILLEVMAKDGIVVEINHRTGSQLNSGWRPPAVNAATAGAALRSKHLRGQAADIFDPEGIIDDWCMNHLMVLEEIGLWLEHPSATKGWCHVQTEPPRSQKRVFYP